LNKQVEELKRWFQNLGSADKKEVLTFLYGGRGKVLIATESLYCGPNPQLITDGLHTGPAPKMAGQAETTAASSRCPTCGK
jgi:hypothetical protein